MDVSLTLHGSVQEISRVLELVRRDLPDGIGTVEVLPPKSALIAIRNEVSADEEFLIRTIALASARDEALTREQIIQDFPGDEGRLNGALGQIGRRWKKYVGEMSPFAARMISGEGLVYKLDRQLALRICEAFEIRL
jgi:hypothetical protein